MNISLSQALRMQSHSCVAFVGAGGKSTAMFKLAQELSSPVIVTATTHLGAWQTKHAGKHISSGSASLSDAELNFQGILLITGTTEGERTKPISESLLTRIHQYCKSHSIPLLIEADGSREKPLKAWADHEPPIPNFVDLIVQVAGLSGLGKALTEEYIHRAEIFSRLSGLEIGETVTINALAQVLSHPNGGLKNIPKNARRVVLLNQADTAETQSMARAMTAPLLPNYQSVLIASLANDQIHAVHEPIAGIILAAGEATRFGEPKQLLDWKGQPFVRVVAKTALEAGLSPVVVVTGANAEKVEAIIKDLDVVIVRNEEWQSGQGSSIKAGVFSLLPPPVLPQIRIEQNAVEHQDLRFGFGGGAVFLLADQPQVGTSIIHALKEKHASGLYPIVAPMVMDRRANPVLFDRVTFADLMNIEGDTGGRAIFHKHKVEYLPWHDESLLLDVDTPEQYQRLISNEDL
ncbi:MAG: putative selenium-dependent hydroxylase accessory protein YqeC [Anaerolineales bacterium]|nr:putative selenium-dependent hydroxylase accessory protein YqeC [Anaerolineales bacterium]